MTDLNDEKKLLKVRDVIYLGRGMEMKDARSGEFFRIGGCGSLAPDLPIIENGCDSGLYFIYDVKLEGGGNLLYNREIYPDWETIPHQSNVYCAKMDNFDARCVFFQTRGILSPYHEGIPVVGIFSERVLEEIMKRVNKVEMDKEQEAP